MQMNLRKARKLESKINAHVESMDLKTAIKVRALSTPEARKEALHAGRIAYLGDLGLRRALIKTRFQIRQQISDANYNTGVTALINKREELKALLEKGNDGVDTLDHEELEDLAKTKATALSNGDTARGYGETSVTLAAPISTKEDLEQFKKVTLDLKKELEDVEDQLSQKNLGVIIALNDDIVSLLQSVGLL